MSNQDYQTQNQQISATQRKEQLKPFIFAAQRQIESLLNGDTARAKQFMAAALVVASDNTLKNCEPDSIVQALVGIAMLDLSVDKNIGHAYLVPYAGKAQLQIGYKGFVQLLFRAGWLVKCFPVYECDKFSMSFDGWDNKVEFVPDIDNREEGDNEWVYANLRGVYVVSRNADTKDEYSTFVSKKIIEKMRKTSPNQKINNYTKAPEKKRLEQGLPVGVWESWFAEMAMGKGVKKLAKVLPIGDPRAQMAIIADDKADIGKPVNFKASSDEGFIIDMDDDSVINGESINVTSIDAVITAIESAATRDDLNAILSDLEKLSADDKKTASTAWKDKLKAIQVPVEKDEPKKEGNDKPSDLVLAINECSNKDELLALIGQMPPEVEMEHSALLDQKMDSFEK
jgi:recombination protein RecT